MSIHKYQLSGILLFLFTVNLWSQSLEESVRLALEQNAEIRAAGEKVKQSDLVLKSSTRSTLPTLDLEASYSHITDVAEVEFPAVPPMQARSVELGVHDSYDMGLALNYNLFTGFADRARISLSRSQYQLSENQRDKTQKEIAFQVISLYRQIQIAGLNTDALRAAEKRIGVQMKRIKSLLRNGLALPVDTLSLSLAALQYNQRILSMQAARQNLLNRLSVLAGQKIDVQSFAEEAQQREAASYREDAREELQALNIQKDVVDARKQLARSGYFPRIRLKAAVKYGKPGADMIANDWMTYGMAAVGLQWNLWSWGADKASVESEEAAIRELEYKRQSLQETLRNRYDSALRDLQTEREQLEVADRALQVAREKMRLIREQLEQGMASTTDFNETNLELTRAEVEFRKFRVMLTLRYNEIEYMSGKPINEWSL